MYQIGPVEVFYASVISNFNFVEWMKIWLLVSYSTAELMLLVPLKLVEPNEAEDWSPLVNSHVFQSLEGCSGFHLVTLVRGRLASTLL